MATKRSRAAAAAAANVPSTVARHSGRVWSRHMVEAAAAVFAELDVMPSFERDAIAERVAGWYRFVDVVAEGAVAPDAAALAAEVVRFGVRFLTAHPEHVLVGGAIWGLDDVEAMARWFGAARGREPKADVVARCAAFERVVRSGLVRDEAMPLATAMLHVIEEWRAR